MGSTRAGMNLIKKIVKEGHDLCGSGGVNDHVKLVTIFFGSNDCSPINNNITHRLVSLPEFSSNLHTMIDDLRAAGINNVLLITPPPRGYDPALTAPYAEAVVEVGKARRVPVADFFQAVLDVADWQKEVLRRDRLHLTPKGNQVVYAAVVKAIQQYLPSITPEVLHASTPAATFLAHQQRLGDMADWEALREDSMQGR